MKKHSMKLVVVCVECGTVGHAPFDGEKLHSKELYQSTGWVLSLVEPKENLLAPLCGPCAEKVYPPEVLTEVKKRFQ